MWRAVWEAVLCVVALWPLDPGAAVAAALVVFYTSLARQVTEAALGRAGVVRAA